jgi:hypothetical protein
MRGDLPVKEDTDVTENDLRGKNLVLFGDPGSNTLIAKALEKMPLRWTATDLAFGNRHFDARDHLPALICPSPYAVESEHYLVLNSGHSFHEKEFASLNYLLFPRLGDWAVWGLKTEKSGNPGWEVMDTGFFDEHWEKPLHPW